VRSAPVILGTVPCNLKQIFLPVAVALEAEVLKRLIGRDPAPLRAIEKGYLQEVRLYHVFERSDFLVQPGRKRRYAHGPAAVAFDDGEQEFPVQLVEPFCVDTFEFERP